jgi:hypothetical protein
VKLAFAEFIRSNTALLYWSTCGTALLHAIVSYYYFDRFDPASVKQATGKRIQVRSKVALRFAGAWDRNAPIAVSVISE